jgi:hypothetical protein
MHLVKSLQVQRHSQASIKKGGFINIKYYIVVLIISHLLAKSYAQVDSTILKSNDQVDEQINQHIELLSEHIQSEDGDLSNLVEIYAYLKKHPLNLNIAKKEELMELQLLSEIQINHLINHREKNGYLMTIYELQSIDGFDVPTIKKILPYVYVSNYFNSSFFSVNEMLKYGKHEYVMRLQRIIEKQSGYMKPDSLTKVTKPNSYYLGDPNRIFARYHFQYNNAVSLALSGEKDAGEEFFKGTQKKGFDFYSGHIGVKNIKFLKTLVIGDYQATFGQGLTLWQGFAFGKSAAVMSIKRYGSGIKAYQSFDENRFFRGIAGTFNLKKIELTGLISYKKLDANVNLADTSTNGDIEIISLSSLSLGGLHNTTNLIQDKAKISQLIISGNAAYNNRNFHIGCTFQSMHLSSKITKTHTLYNQFDYQGKQNSVVGMDYSYVFKNANFFGEYAMSVNKGYAFCQGLILALDPKLTFTAHYRHFEKNFQNLYANAISENTLPQNEKSIYIGAEAKLFKSLTLSVFLDQYKFDWIKSKASAPSNGRDVLAQLNFIPTKKIDMSLRFRNRTHMENSMLENNYTYLVPYEQYNYRYQVSAQLSPDVKIKSRIEYTYINKKNEQYEEGVAFAQDIIYKKVGNPISITLRYAVFDTKSYDSRVYIYENDVLYGYSVPALYYKGQRAYLLVNWDITRHFEIWFRIAQSIFDNQQIIQAASLNQIDGNTKSEFKIQLRLKF